MEGLLQHEARCENHLVMLTSSPSSLKRIADKANTGTSQIGSSKTFYSIRTSEQSLASSSRSSSSCTEQSFESQASSPITIQNIQQQHDCGSPMEFRLDVLRALDGATMRAETFTQLRNAIEPHLRKARLARERASRSKLASASSFRSFSGIIGSTIGVPYPSLRSERRFLFCEHSFPMHTVLADVLNIPDLSKAHHSDDLLLPLLNAAHRVRFQAVYDSFVQSVCIPLLHSMALSNQLFQDYENASVTYRYQAFPTIRVSRPQDASGVPHHDHDLPTCDTIRGYGPACLTFHVPLTPCDASNSLYTETRPGREDWHPLETKSIGLAYVFDGARCLSFYLPNTSSRCSVALTFRVQLYQSEEPRDAFSDAGPGYYEEAVVNLRPGSCATAKKKDGSLLSPDHRNGYPFI